MIITVVLAIILYPISGVFFVIGRIGYVLGQLADYIFTKTNFIIKKLWADIKHTRVVRDDAIEEAESVTVASDGTEVVDGGNVE